MAVLVRQRRHRLRLLGPLGDAARHRDAPGEAKRAKRQAAGKWSLKKKGKGFWKDLNMLSEEIFKLVTFDCLNYSKGCTGYVDIHEWSKEIGVKMIENASHNASAVGYRSSPSWADPQWLPQQLQNSWKADAISRV